MAAHAETRNRAARTVAPRRIVGVHVIDQLARDEGLETRRGVFRAVPVPAVLAVGTNDDHAVPVGHLRQRRLYVKPRFLIAAISVKQVQHRHSDSALRRVGHDHDDRDLLFHRFAPHGDPVYRRSRNRRGQPQNGRQQQDHSILFHTSNYLHFTLNIKHLKTTKSHSAPENGNKTNNIFAKRLLKSGILHYICHCNKSRKR